MTNNEFLEKYDSGYEFSEKELQSFAWGELPYECELVERISGDDHRWEKEMTTVNKINDRYFALYWMRGLTECQENEYYDQPVEVELNEYEKTITVREWNEIEK